MQIPDSALRITLVSLCALASGAISACSRQPTPQSSPNRPVDQADASLGAHDKYLPDNCTSVKLIRGERIRASAAYKELTKDSADSRSRLLFPEVSGLFVADMESETIATSEDGRLTIISTNRAINVDDLTKKANYQKTTVGNYTLYDSGLLALAVSHSKIVLLGSVKDLEAVLKRDKKPDLSEGLKKSMALADFSKCTASAVDIQSKAGRRGFLSEDAEAIAIITDLNSDITTTTHIVFKDPKTADDQAKAQEDKTNKGLKDAGFGTAAVSRSGSRITVKVTITAEEIRKNKDKIGRKMGFF